MKKDMITYDKIPYQVYSKALKGETGMGRTKWIVLLAFLVVIGIVGFNLVGNGGIKNISTDELGDKLDDDNNQNKIIFIDVREPSEFESGHIEGMVNVPLSTIEAGNAKLSKDAEIVLICRSGNRSMQAAEILKESGYRQIINVEGGIQSWEGEVVKE